MSVLQRHSSSSSDASADLPPRFAIGHMTMHAGDVQQLTRFYTTIGMRLVVDMGHASIIELRGGTHIIIRAGQAGQAQLDFIVDDIDETHNVMAGAGANPTVIRRGDPHDVFTATDPEGNHLVISSTHAIGPV